MIDFEKALLVYCCKSTKALEAVSLKRLTGEQFSGFDNQKLFTVLMYTYRKYKSLLDDVMLKQLLEKSSVKNLEDQKRIILLFHELSQTTPPTQPVDFIIAEFISKYVKDETAAAIKSAALMLRDNQTERALSTLRSSVSKLTTLSGDERLEEGYIGDDTVDRLQKYVDKRDNPTKFGGLSTGYPRFDAETNGLQKGQVVMVMGAPKSAKSILLINVARNVVKQGKRVLFIVNEGGRDLVLQRYTALDAGVNYSNLRDGKLTQEEEQKFRQSLEALKGSKSLYICSIPPVVCTTSLLTTKLEELELTEKFDLVVVDSFHLMDSDNPSTKKEDDWKKLGSIALELKSFAMLHKLPVLTVAHVNREGSKKKGAYGMSDMGRSFEVTKTIDTLISWRVDNQDEFDMLHSGSATMKMIASRDSATAIIEIWVDTNKMSIEEKPGGFSLDQATAEASAGGYNP